MPNGTVEGSPEGRFLYGLAALTTLTAYLVQSGLLYAWARTFGALFERLANVGFGGFYGRGAVHPLRWLRSVDHAITDTLKEGIAGSERAMIYTVTQAAAPLALIAVVLAELGLTIFHLGESTTSRIRHAIEAHHAGGTGLQLLKLEAAERGIEQRLGRLEHAKRAGGAAAGAQDWERLNRGIDRLTAKETRLARRIGHLERANLRERHGTLTHPIGRSADWTKVMTRPAAVAMTTAALGSMGFRFLKCSAWQRTARNVGCGLGGLLESFAAGALDVLLLRDLCRVVGAIERLAIAFEPQLLKLIDEIEGFLCGGDAVVPSGVVRHDLRKVAPLPTGIVPADLEPPARRQIAA